MEEIFGKFDDFEYRERKPLNSLVENIGINNAPFVVSPTIINKRVTHPAYSVWCNMLKRSYSKVYKEKNPTYLEVTCCEDWLLFTNFAKWFKDNYIKDCQLDKDLLCKDNKIYSPKTCLFIPREINTFLTLHGKDRGSYPLGVSKEYNKYKASISRASISDGGIPSNYLGLFITKEEAHQAWQKAKLEQAIAFNFPPLQRVIDQLTFEIENNLETTSL